MAVGVAFCAGFAQASAVVKLVEVFDPRLFDMAECEMAFVPEIGVAFGSANVVAF